MPAWKISQEPVDYEEAVAFMEAQVAAIIGARDEGLGIREKEMEQEAKSGDFASPELRPLRSEERGAGAIKKTKSGDFASPELRPLRSEERGAGAIKETRPGGRRSPELRPLRSEERGAGVLHNELIWLLEHPPLYTAGTSAKEDDLLDQARFPVYRTGRGGQFTYHGPGQRVAYVMLDLKSRYAPAVPDLRDYVQRLERWLILTLAEFGIQGELREGRVGIWVDTPRGEEKIAALGVRVRQGVSYHGVALNVHPDLSHYLGIVPCGISGHGVTSMHALGVGVSMQKVDRVLQDMFDCAFS